MLEELGRYKCTKFTTESKVVDKTHRSPFLKGLKKIGEVDEIKKFKWSVKTKRSLISAVLLCINWQSYEC